MIDEVGAVRDRLLHADALRTTYGRVCATTWTPQNKCATTPLFANKISFFVAALFSLQLPTPSLRGSGILTISITSPPPLHRPCCFALEWILSTSEPCGLFPLGG